MFSFFQRLLSKKAAPPDLDRFVRLPGDARAVVRATTGRDAISLHHLELSTRGLNFRCDGQSGRLAAGDRVEVEVRCTMGDTPVVLSAAVQRCAMQRQGYHEGTLEFLNISAPVRARLERTLKTLQERTTAANPRDSYHI